MPGVALSRWTMSYFIAALVAFVAAEGMLVAGFGYPAANIAAAETLVLVHLVAIGWLSLLLLGALFQFVPVLVARPLCRDAWPLPILVTLLVGLTALLAGFLRLAGVIVWDGPYFAAASLLLGTGFASAVWTLGRTLWAARPLDLPARFVVAGLCSLTATVALGIEFAFALGGYVEAEHLLELAGAGWPVHAIAGLGGWMTFTAMGVSYRLFAMFMLSPELNGPGSRAVLGMGAGALIVAVGGGVAAICVNADLDVVLATAGGLGLAALLLYGRDVLHLFRARKRRVIELNSRMSALALISLAAAVLMIIALLTHGSLSDHIAVVVFLVAFGWLSGIGLAKLYKIVAFLTWLECYGPILGKGPTPRVQDLVDETRAGKWFLLYFVAVWAGTAALLFSQVTVFRIAAAGMLIATSAIVVHIVRTRRLYEVIKGSALPDGVQRPRLLYRHSC